MKKNAVSLFAGCGGLCKGGKKAGFKIVTANDIDEQNTDTYAQNFPDTRVLTADIKTLGAADLNPDGHHIDIVFGGSPCQSFSVIGKQDPDDPRGKLPFEFARIVSELDADYFLLENVEGMTKNHGLDVLEELAAIFSFNGYGVVPWQVLDASDYGVPQRRRRLFLMGYKLGLTAPVYPPAIAVRKTCRDAIGDLEDRAYAKTIRGHELTRHSPDVVRRFWDCKPGTIEKDSRFPKLDPDGQAPTLRAGTRSQGRDEDGNVTGGRHTPVRPIHYDYPRVLTTAELARIHGYDDEHIFAESKAQAAYQIGNSVPPPLAYAVLRMYAIAINKNWQKGLYKKTAPNRKYETVA